MSSECWIDGSTQSKHVPYSALWHPWLLLQPHQSVPVSEPEPQPGLQDLLAQPVPALPHPPEELGWSCARLSAAEKCDPPGLSVNAKQQLRPLRQQTEIRYVEMPERSTPVKKQEKSDDDFKYVKVPEALYYELL